MTHFILALLFVNLSWANPSVTDKQNNILKNHWPKETAQLLIKSRKDIFYKGFQETENYIALFNFNAPTEKTLLIVTGLEDPIPHWNDTVKKAQEAGFSSVAVIEIRGQGYSERKNSEKIIHVNDFEEYYSDLLAAFKALQSEEILSNPTYIISHSTGSLVLGNTLSRIQAQIPDLNLMAQALWSPLVLLNVSPKLNNFVVRPLLSLITTLHDWCCGIFIGRKFHYGQFEKNKLTNDPEKFKLIHKMYLGYDLRSSGVSLRWAIEALAAGRIYKDQVLDKVRVPTLFIKAGNEKVVNNNFTYNNKNITETTIPGAKHALHMETDQILNSVVQQSFDFFNQQ